MEFGVERTNAPFICASILNNCNVAMSAETNFLHMDDVPTRRAQVDSCGSGQPLVE